MTVSSSFLTFSAEGSAHVAFMPAQNCSPKPSSYAFPFWLTIAVIASGRSSASLRDENAQDNGPGSAEQHEGGTHL